MNGMLRSHADRNARRGLAAFAASAVSVAALSASPTPALAQGCTGQPGTSALEQYCEAVPRGDGGRDRPNASNSGAKSSGTSVSGRTEQALRRSGVDGAAVAALAASRGSSSGATAGAEPKKPSPGSGSSSKGKSSTSVDGAPTSESGAVKGVRVEGPDDPSGNPLKAATNAASSGPVAGPTLVWGLVGMTAIGAVAAVILRRRTPLAPPGDDES